MTIESLRRASCRRLGTLVRRAAGCQAAVDASGSFGYPFRPFPRPVPARPGEQGPRNSETNPMRENIHPAYPTSKVHCACGATWETRSTAGDLHLDICSNCHPFFTGKQKLIDTQGRIDRFKKKYANAPAAPPKKKAAPAKKEAPKSEKAKKPAKKEAKA